MKKCRLLKKGDIFLFLTILIILLIWLIGLLMSSPCKAVIYIDGTVYESIELSTVTESYVIEVNGTSVQVEKGRIGFIFSDCPDNTCIKSGFLSKSGQTAACVPNGVVITLISSDAPDGVTG